MSPETHRGITSLAAKHADAKVFALDYRLSPEHPFPAGLDDAVNCYKWLISSEGPNVKPSDLVIAGDSAGGGMTFATLLKIKELGLANPAAFFVFSPWVDLTAEFSQASFKENEAFDVLPPFDRERNNAMATRYAGSVENANNPLISPIFADLKNLPPGLVQVGGCEILRDEGMAIAKKLEEAGVESILEVYPDMVHVFQFLPFEPQTTKAFESVGAFVKSKVPDKAYKRVAHHTKS